MNHYPLYIRRLITFILFMVTLSWLALKAPISSLTILAQYFHVNDQIFKLSISVNMFTFSAAQLFWSNASKRYGKRPVLLSAMAISLLGLLLSICSTNIYLYLVSRVITVFGISVGVPAIRGLINYAISLHQLAKVYCIYSIVIVAVPVIGPIAGGYITHYLGWRYIFIFITILFLIHTFLIWRLLPKSIEKHKPMSVSTAWRRIKRIIVLPLYWHYTSLQIILGGFISAYFIAMPYWYVNYFHMNTRYFYWLSLVPITSFIIGALLTGSLLAKINFRQITTIGIYVLIGCCLFSCYYSCTNKLSIINLNIVIFLFSLATGIITPITRTTLEKVFQHSDTTRSIITASLQALVGGLLVQVTTNLNLANNWSLTLYVAAITLLCIICFLVFKGIVDGYKKTCQLVQ